LLFAAAGIDAPVRAETRAVSMSRAPSGVEQYNYRWS